MHVVSQNSSNMTASESTDDDSEFNQIRVRQIVKKIIYGVKFIWISIGNLDPTIIFVILEWLLLVYWSRSISLVFLRGSPLDRRNSYRHWWWTYKWIYNEDPEIPLRFPNGPRRTQKGSRRKCIFMHDDIFEPSRPSWLGYTQRQLTKWLPPCSYF